MHGALETILGKNAPTSASFGQHFELADDAFGHAHFQVLGDAAGDLLDRIHFEGDLHAAHAGEGVDEDGDGGAFGFFKEQGGAVRFDGAVGEFGDFEIGIDFEGDAFQLAFLFEGADKIAEVAVGHGVGESCFHYDG